MEVQVVDAQTPILVVEDEKEIRELMALHLLRQGYKVTECATATEALGEIKKTNFRLLVLDWMLPGMSGIEFCTQLRGSEHFSRVRILMLTARGQEVDRVRGLDAGADDYLVKPFSVSEFLARVGSLIPRGSSEASN